MNRDYNIRFANQEDVGEIIQLHETVQNEGEWTKKLINGTHPTTSYKNFTVVTDNETKRIVSSMCYIPQQWKYDSINFRCARLEMVSTLAEHRSKGLVRKQFEFLHKQCENEEIFVTVVVGIAWFYRKFGYDMALRYNNEYIVSANQAIRQYTYNDLMFSIELGGKNDLLFYKQLQAICEKRYRIICDTPIGFLEQLYCNKEEENLKLYIIKTKAENPVGAISISPNTDENMLDILFCEVSSGISWLDVTPCILRFLKEVYADKTEFFRFVMPPGHPLYAFLQDVPSLQPNTEAPFAWYIRISNYERFISLLNPYFEKRFADSLIPGYSGDIRISFYDGGIQMQFVNGKLIKVINGLPQSPNAFIPEEHFKRLLFGYKSLKEIQRSSAEVNVSGTEKIVLDTLFPKQESSFISVQ